MFIPLAVAATGLVLPGIASASPTKVGTESFISTADINAEGGPVTASGVINDTGQDIVVHLAVGGEMHHGRTGWPAGSSRGLPCQRGPKPHFVPTAARPGLAQPHARSINAVSD
jgi:hypothetical protein